jgi:hypothetical protein
MLVQVRQQRTGALSVVNANFGTEWLTADDSNIVVGETDQSNANYIVHKANLQSQIPYTEFEGQANWGTLYYATLSSGVSSSLLQL